MTQRKFMGIFQSNQILERKLNKLLYINTKNDYLSDNLKEVNYNYDNPNQKILLKPIEQKNVESISKKNTDLKKINNINQPPIDLPVINSNYTSLPGFKDHAFNSLHEFKLFNTTNYSSQIKKEFKDYQYFDRRFKANKFKSLQKPNNDLNSQIFPDEFIEENKNQNHLEEIK